jgi:hypothetical protein
LKALHSKIFREQRLGAVPFFRYAQEKSGQVIALSDDFIIAS